MQRHEPGPASQQLDSDMALPAFVRGQSAHDPDSPDAGIGGLDGEHFADAQPLPIPDGEHSTVTVVALVLHVPGFFRWTHLLPDLIG